LNADIKAALHVIETDQIESKIFISKNVCHGVIYDKTMHQRVKQYKDNNPGLNLLVDGMECYLNKKSCKAFHDPLAACVAIEPDICKFEKVEIYREKRKIWLLQKQ
jgi:pyrimidine-specific ribonucleoside hydrolase